MLRFALPQAATLPLAASHMTDAVRQLSTRDSRSFSSMLGFARAVQPIALLFLRPTFSAPDSRILGLAPLVLITGAVMA